MGKVLRLLLAVVGCCVVAGVAWGALGSWDTSFETTPSVGDPASQGPARIQELKEFTSERANVESEWGPSTNDNGRHLAGSAMVFNHATDCDLVTTLNDVAMTALAAADEGRLCFQESDDTLWRWDGAAWEEVQGVTSGLYDYDEEAGTKADASALEDCAGATESCTCTVGCAGTDPDTRTWLDFMDGAPNADLQVTVTCPTIAGITWNIRVTALVSIEAASAASYYFRLAEDGTGIAGTWVNRLNVGPSESISLFYTKTGAASATAFIYTLQGSHATAMNAETTAHNFSRIDAQCIPD